MDRQWWTGLSTQDESQPVAPRREETIHRGDDNQILALRRAFLTRPRLRPFASHHERTVAVSPENCQQRYLGQQRRLRQHSCLGEDQSITTLPSRGDVTLRDPVQPNPREGFVSGT
jgi:hypothetical protein